MDIGESLTRGTIWLALSLYVSAELVKTATRAGESSASARWLNSFGFATFLAHVGCAFHFFHGWSHSAAYADTARETAELFGRDWGGGLYVNYVFGLVWLFDAGWSWSKPKTYHRRPKWITRTVRFFFLFMMLNGAVVFVHGRARYFGLILCLTLAACWWQGRGRIARDQTN